MPKEVKPKEPSPIEKAEQARQEKHQAFNQELMELCDKYGVNLEPVTQITIKDK